MSRTRSRQPLTPIDMVDVEHTPEPASKPLKKLDFSASARKKGQTPKKRAVFTPMKIHGDSKPKIEPDSPTPMPVEPLVKPKRSGKKVNIMLQPKVELEETGDKYTPSISFGAPKATVEMDVKPSAKELDISERSTSPPPGPEVDVKPDVRELEDLLDRLELESNKETASSSSHPATPPPKGDSHASSPVRNRSPTPLFSAYDSSPESPTLAPADISLTSAASPLFRSRRHSPSHLTESTLLPAKVDPFDLFSSDSPPPPVRQMSRSSSMSSTRRSNSRALSDEPESPVAGPSKQRCNRPRSPSHGLSDAESMLEYDDASRPTSPICASSAEDMPSPSTADLPLGQPITQTPAKARRRAFLDFLDTVAKTDEATEDEYEYDYGQDDESLGSLRDFLVDDDGISYLSDSSGIERDMRSEAEDSDIVEVKVDRSIVYSGGNSDSDCDSDIMVEEAVSHPKIGKAGGLGFLEEFADSETSDQDDLLDAIDDLTIAGPSIGKKDKPKGKSKAQEKGRKGPKVPKWAIQRVQLAQEVFDDLDKRVFEGKLGPNGAGAKIIWNKRLLTTAGTAQRKRRRLPGGETSWDLAIQLSEKVCTGEEQVLSTVAHEMCHLACWVIDNEFKNPHGKVFKSWGRKVMRKRDDLEVTTKHDYIIEYKYQWRCLDCKKVYKRHSKSIDIDKQGCGICKGKLEALFETKSRGTSTFQVYLKQNMSLAKAALPGASHGEVMRALSARWADAGPEADHEAHWKAVLAASRT